MQTRRHRSCVEAFVIAIACTTVVSGPSCAQSLEEQTRRPRVTSSITDDSQRLHGYSIPRADGFADDDHVTDGFDDDSQRRDGRPRDYGTNSLDSGAMGGGAGAHP